MSPKPLLSVVIPAFNAEAYLGEAIETVLGQDYSPIEVVVVDNASTDGTAAVARCFAGIRLVREDRPGPAAARNAGISWADGDYLGFLDADDLSRADRFSLQMDCLLAHPHLGYVLARVQSFVEPGRVIPGPLRSPGLLTPREGFIGAAVVRRETFDRVGTFDTDYRIGEDLEWLLRAQRAGIPTATLIDVLVEHRLHDANLTRDVALGHRNLLKMIRASLPSNPRRA